jgi:hypothetical protein
MVNRSSFIFFAFKSSKVRIQKLNYVFVKVFAISKYLQLIYSSLCAELQVHIFNHPFAYCNLQSETSFLPGNSYT